MSIITRLVRMLGYNIVRYSNLSSASEKIAALHPELNREQALISREQAHQALRSVGRKTDIPSFTYYKRPEKSSALMEELENLWWNANGRLIEKVWVFSENVNYRYRSSYVSKSAAFFKQPGKKTKILDLGCGSGWFGRMLADHELEYHGMDFSSTQIEIANGEKQKSVNKAYLNYYCLSDFTKIENIGTMTGIVIHAFLHHLYWDDLYQLFDELVKVLPDGCRFFIMEPVYPDQKIKKISGAKQSVNNHLVSAYREHLNNLKNNLIDENQFDTKTERELMNIGSESLRNGFFLSPKEVPFRQTEFQTFLSKYLKIENSYPCGVLNLETAQLVEKIRPEALQQQHADQLFPLAASLDQFLIHNDYFEANENNYLFTAFECTLNKGNT